MRDTELVLDRGDGAWVWDTAGRRYLDGSASLWYANVGHGRPEPAVAAAKQMRRLEAYSIFGDYANAPARELAARLSDLGPLDDSKVFLTNGGGESIDTAAKLARAYWRILGHPGKTHLISREASYHGTNGFGTSIGGIPGVASGFGRLIPDTSVVAFDSAEALDRRIEELGAAAVAAFFCEPVIGAGGVHRPPDGYLAAVAEICARHEVMLVVDSVICGFGRLGTWFGIERFDVTPDMITFAKGLSSGYLPIGGVLVSGRVAEPFWTRPRGPVFAHGATYAGHPACCAVALSILDIYERDDLIRRGCDLEDDLERALAPLRDDPRVGDVRAGLGLMAAVDLGDEFVERLGSGAGEAFQLAVREAGMLVRRLDRGVAIAPPLVVSQGEIVQIGTIVKNALDLLESGVPGAPRSTVGRTV